VSAHGGAVLVVGPAWVGDMVMAQSLFKLLRDRAPDLAIDVLAPVWSRPLLARMPEVRDGIVLPIGHGELGLGRRIALGRGLGARGYHQALVLPNSLKSALVPFLARIPIRTGYVGEWRWGVLNDVRRLDKRELPMTVQRYVALALPPGTPLPRPIPEPRLQIREQTVMSAVDALLNGHVPDVPVLALCPGAEYGPAKRWPAGHFAELAKAKLAEGWQVWIFGSDKDQPVGNEINRLAGGGCIDLTGRTNLEQAIDLLSLASVVVANDSGLMHVAAALDRPLVAVYGSSDPGFTPPLNPRARVLRLDLECSPCFRRECPYGHYRCLRDLTAATVAAAVDDQARGGSREQRAATTPS
jgi:heptosyltransferase II